ncbi:Uncharacterized protein At2g29880 [Linum grandiflorum]
MGRKRKVQKEESNEEDSKKYFTWTDELAELLVRCMIEMVDQKKVDDKGKFMAGAFKEMERLMEEAKLGCGVKWDPNILSRIKTLKTKFLVVQELKGRSGVGWDESRKIVLLDDDVYADYVVSHKDCAKMNRVPFPYYECLEYVFGKVYATSAKAVGLDKLDAPCMRIEVHMTMALEWSNPAVGDQQQAEGQRVDEDDYINLEDEVPPPTLTEKVNQSERGNQSKASNKPKKTRRYRENVESLDNEEDYFQPMLERTVRSIETMAGDSEYKNRQRNTLFEKVAKVEGFTPLEAIDEAYNIVKDPLLTQFFFDLKSAVEWKMFILRGLRGP